MLGYASIFEALWKQSELYEHLTGLYDEARISNISQREFITIVAHELRNPIQPIIGLSEALRSRISYGRGNNTIKANEMLDAIARNAKRIHMLTEDILDITRIETNTLKLNKEGFSLREVINSVVQDYQNELRKTDKHIELLSIYDAVVTEPHNNTNNLMIIADQNRIYQVLSNLLNNAIKFTNEGTINITATTSKKSDGNDKVCYCQYNGLWDRNLCRNISAVIHKVCNKIQ